ncbi:MAG TPA: FAD-dependent oxidoreductase [Gaiellaceae bacterium]|nr:FAD-dependent oxidoreductase [Gaiellaceae bacterium]
MILIAGAGATGAGIAYRLALRGAENVVLCDRGEIASGSTSRAMGGVRQQFSTAAEVMLARESIAFFAELGPPFFHQVGYLFLATTEEGLAALEERREVQTGLGVPVERIDPAFVAGLETRDVLGATFCAEDGVADPPAVAQELVRRATELGVELREHTLAESLLDDADTLVIACGPWSAALGRRVGVELPVRPLCRQLLATERLPSPPAMLPMVVEAESGFHFRRRGDRLVLAMGDAEPRWGFDTTVDESVFADRLERLANRFPAATGLRIADAWAGLYDMTPDAHPILGRVADGVHAACGFSGHGFMQSPAVAQAIAEELLDGEASIDLSPYRLDRFADGSSFAEAVVL